MLKWTKKKLGYRKDIEDLKRNPLLPDSTTFNPNNITDTERDELFFDRYKFYPIVNTDKRYIGAKNTIRMLIKNFQRYNYYCSTHKTSIKDKTPSSKKLCNEDTHVIGNMSRVSLFSKPVCVYPNDTRPSRIERFNNPLRAICINDMISYDTYLDIYYIKENDDMTNNAINQLMYKFVGNNNSTTRFTPTEWDNILYYFRNIKDKTEKMYPLLDESSSLGSNSFKSRFSDGNDEDNDDEYYNEELAEYGGRKKRRKTTKKKIIKIKTTKRKNNKKRRKTRKY